MATAIELAHEYARDRASVAGEQAAAPMTADVPDYDASQRGLRASAHTYRQEHERAMAALTWCAVRGIEVQSAAEAIARSQAR